MRLDLGDMRNIQCGNPPNAITAQQNFADAGPPTMVVTDYRRFFDLLDLALSPLLPALVH